jgi:hypothetical protein
MNKKIIFFIVFLCILFISGCSLNMSDKNNSAEETDKAQKSGLIKTPNKSDDSESSVSLESDKTTDADTEMGDLPDIDNDSYAENLNDDDPAFGDWDNLKQDDYNDFIGYLLEVVPEAQEYVDMGMSALVTGETMEAGGFPACIYVVLGTDHEQQFVREKHYAITPEGGVLELDWLTGDWEYVFGGENYDEGFDGAGKDILEMSDDELIGYVIGNAPEVSERMNMLGGANLKLVVIENIREDIPNEGKCREVWLVWDIGGDDYDIMIIYAVGGSGRVYEYDSNDGGWNIVSAAESQSTQTLTMEQAMDFLYEHHVDSELFYPGELDKWEGDAPCYGFVYDDGGKHRYVWVNSVTGEVSFADEVENYTGE